MQWIKHKKEERMADAAKVIGAVRLVLVDIEVVIEELDTEEMKQVPEIHWLMYETSIYKHMPSRNSKFGVEKSKPRSTSPVVVAVPPGAPMQYFDVEAKTWKSLASTIPAIEARECHCAVSAGSKLFVAGESLGEDCFFQYDAETNKWEGLPHSGGKLKYLCVIDDHIYGITVRFTEVPQRYNFAKRQWQTIAPVAEAENDRYYEAGHNGAICRSKMFVLYENKYEQLQSGWSPALLKCFDPVKNKWEVRATTCQPHFGSSLVVVNNRLYVAGGRDSIEIFGYPIGNAAPVEMYNEEKNTWSVVEQKHIPPNNLGAVEIEGRVFFILNNFPIDSGIRIPSGELYPVPLGEWENLGKIDQSAVLCCFPVKQDSLKPE